MKIKWNKYPDIKPTENKEYLITMQLSGNRFLKVSRYVLDLKKFRKFDFDYLDNIQSGFVDYDSEFGYFQITDKNIKAWAELPNVYDGE